MLLGLGCIFYLFLGIYIYKVHKESKINRVFLGLSTCCSIWAIGYAFMLISPNMGMAYVMRMISGLAYSFFIGYWLYFAVLLNNENYKKYINVLKFLTHVPAIIFVLTNIMIEPSKTIRREYYGWIDVFEVTIFQNIYNIAIIIFIIAGIIIVLLRGRNSKKNRVKKQTRIILITFTASFSLGLITDIILPMFGIILFPSAVLTGVIALWGIYYAISKHNMMAITPKFLSEYIFNTVNEPIFIFSEDFIIQNCNKASLDMIGYKHEELEQKKFDTLIKNGNVDFNSIIKNGYVKNIEVELQKKEGDYVTCELSGTAIYDEYNDILGIVILLHDISERKKLSEIEKNYTIKLEEKNLMLKRQIEDRIHAEETIRHFVYHDALTELPNRKKMLENVNMLIENKNEVFAVLFIDLDGFKSINDNFGHQVGDKVLKIVSKILKNIIGENDTVSRIGGDEFIILLGNLKFISYIEEIAGKIQETLKQTIICDGNNLLVGASIGISIFPEDGTDSDTLIKNADLAMYEVKKNGGYGHTTYSPQMNDKVIDKLNMKVKLNKALLNKEFVAYYQPIMDLKSMTVLNTECLIRLMQGDRIIYPMKFIPIAKNVGEIVAIDNWMLENACIQCKRWHEFGLKDFNVSVNVSYTQLKQPNFVSFVENILEANSLPAKCLNLEITEDEAMEAPEIIIDILTELKSIGIQISLDDFGTGYSSINYINRLPIDKIKIDKSLIMNLEKDYKNLMIIKSIIMMGRSLNIKIVAEGIETKEQLNILKELDCDFIQGYLIGKPMEVVEFERKFINRVDKLN